MDIVISIPDLVPQLGALHSSLTLASFVKGNQRRQAFQLEQLPYCLGASLTNLTDAVEIQWAILESTKPEAYGPNTEVVVPDLERDRLAYRVDAFLESMVRAQNALWPYLQQRLQNSLPASLRDIVNDLTRANYSFGEPIDRAILEYWSLGGQRLREYRDLSQHYAVVPSDARILITGSVIQSFFMPLPHDPAARRADQLLYDNDSPDAIPYCINAFCELVSMVRFVTKELLGTSARDPKSSRWVMFKEGMVGWPAQGTPAMSVSDFEKRLSEVAERFAREDTASSTFSVNITDDPEIEA